MSHPVDNTQQKDYQDYGSDYGDGYDSDWSDDGLEPVNPYGPDSYVDGQDQGDKTLTKKTERDHINSLYHNHVITKQQRDEMLRKVNAVSSGESGQAILADIEDQLYQIENPEEGGGDGQDLPLGDQIDQYLKDHASELSDKDKTYLEKLKSTLDLDNSTDTQDAVVQKFEEFKAKALQKALTSQSAQDIAGAISKEMDPQAVQDVLDKLGISSSPISKADFQKLLASPEFQELVPGLKDAIQAVSDKYKAIGDAVTKATTDANAVNAANRAVGDPDNSSLVNTDFSAFKILYDIKKGKGQVWDDLHKAEGDLKNLLGSIYTAATGDANIPTNFVNAKSGSIEVGNTPTAVPDFDLVPAYLGEDFYEGFDGNGGDPRKTGDPSDKDEYANCPDWLWNSEYPITNGEETYGHV